MNNDHIEKVFSVEETDQVLLISIQPKFSELIRTGKKTVELRKRLPKKLLNLAIVYESSPTKKATFLIKIKRIDAAPTRVIWAKYGKKCAVSREYFNDYYRGSKRGVAFIIEEVLPLGNSISRERLEEYDLIPPQDYRYASKEVLKKLIYADAIRRKI